jgi:hypothetical protein
MAANARPQFRVTKKIDGKKVLTSIERPLSKGMQSATTLMRKDVVAALRATPSPSPEGGPPGSDTGDMAASIKKQTKRRRNGGVMGRVGPLKDPVQLAALTRLNTGFVGRDRDGRTYIQGPRPLYENIWRSRKDEFARLIRGG